MAMLKFSISRYSMSRNCGPRDIISLVIPTIGDNKDNNGYIRVMRTLLCGLRERRRPTEVLDRVPRAGPNHIRVVVGKRET